MDLTKIKEWVIDFAEYVPGFAKAAGIVLVLTLLIIVVSWICGLIAALGKQSRLKFVRSAATFYVWFIRGTPTLVQVFIRAGLTAIPKGQMESALALGMSRAGAMQRIILPQVFRIILPSLTNEAISALKNTSLLSTITVVELTLYSQLLIASTFRPFDFYIASAIIYLVMTSLLSRLAHWLERRYALRY
jgi:polar amino acid transport system permease protein